MEKIFNFEKRIQEIQSLRKKFLEIGKKHGTPVYIYDKREVQKNVRDFKKAFQKNGIDINIFFATKSNYYPGVLKTVVEEGENIDVSSQRELKLAVQAGAKRIIYTGPAKTEKDFELILKHHTKVTVNLETLRELALLDKMAKAQKKTVRCGVRIYTKMQSGWTKFGIPLEKLKEFFVAGQKCKSVKFCGVHFHISFNKNPEKYVKTFQELAKYFKKNFTATEREKFEYIDMGGGFYPRAFEGIHSWNPDQEMVLEDFDESVEKILANKIKHRYIAIPSDPIDKFGKAIADVCKKQIIPLLPNVSFYAEPGRFICHSCMHFLLTLMDIKGKQLGITDGGTNMIGWEKLQFNNYAPLFNLSQFDTKKEIPFLTDGSLCTPDDIWGYYLYTKAQPKEGDILLLAYQGAYTYTLAQQFIKDIPEVINL